MDSKLWIGFVFFFSELTSSLSSECLDDDILERFWYTKKGKNSNKNDGTELEFLVIKKSVSWNEAEAFCPSFDVKKSKISQVNLEPEARIALDFSTDKKDPENGSKLAVVDDDDIKNWLARMLSESNYQYDGLWIGGFKKNSTTNWTWVGDKSYEDSIIPESILLENYPSWFDVLKQGPVEKNCLLFNRIGHDVPDFLSENCYLRRPFLCVRAGRKKDKLTIEQVANVTAEGNRFTLYRVIDKENLINSDQKSIRKLNGGGIRWRNARLECRMRGQQLATVLTNEAASAIAKVMLKSRPSIESAWLGGWSLDGSEWTWVSSGSYLSSEKTRSTSYPPWLKGRPHTHDYKFADEDLGRTSRCLVLDRHVCPEHIRPVFLDLNCDKERPFVCQDDIVELRGNFENQDRDILLLDRILQFSAEKMNWNEGDKHCKQNRGLVASIYNSTILSIVLNKMTELSLDHVWIGGHTRKFGKEWKWLDEKDEVLSRKGVGLTSSWCLQSEKGRSFLKADSDTCLNLDREGHGLPLFYGLPCDIIQQHVLCNLPINSTDTSSIEKEESNSYFNYYEDDEDEPREIAPRFSMPQTTEDTNKRSAIFETDPNEFNYEEKNERFTALNNNQDSTTISSILSRIVSEEEKTEEKSKSYTESSTQKPTIESQTAMYENSS